MADPVRDEWVPDEGTEPVPIVAEQVPGQLAAFDSCCEPCGGTGVVRCWSPGGPCPVPDEPGCDTCGPCVECQ